MRAPHVLSLVVCLTSGAVLACRERTDELLPSENGVRELSTMRVVASQFKLYAFDGPVDLDSASAYPANHFADEQWSVRTWSRELGGSELVAILGFLDNERTKYGTDEREGRVRERLGAIRDALSRQPLDSALVAYHFKLNRPGTSGYHFADWLYVYYLDARSRTIVEITNAFR